MQVGEALLYRNNAKGSSSKFAQRPLSFLLIPLSASSLKNAQLGVDAATTRDQSVKRKALMAFARDSDRPEKLWGVEWQVHRKSFRPATIKLIFTCFSNLQGMQEVKSGSWCNTQTCRHKQVPKTRRKRSQKQKSSSVQHCLCGL